MLLDERCHFLAEDFDGDHWQADASAFLETCASLEIPTALERSRSGRGGHVWIFFTDAIPATMARKLGFHVLTETMERRPEIGFKSYDRFFPNQDTLPNGGFGNLIALPLQKAARARNNSVFLDSGMVPHADQWMFLSGLPRMEQGRVEGIVRLAEGRGRIVGVRMVAMEEEDGAEPWKAPPSRARRDAAPKGPMPGSIELVLGDQVYVPKEGLPPSLSTALSRLAAFQNPDYFKAQAMRLPTYDKPRIIACAEDHPHHSGLPRGCLEEALDLLLSSKVKTRVRDERFAGRPLPVKFQGVLRPDQLNAATVMAGHDAGVLAATTAFGKTVIAAWLIAQRGVNTLVLVHRQQLMDQWVERLSQFLGVPARAGLLVRHGTRKVDLQQRNIQHNPVASVT